MYVWVQARNCENMNAARTFILNNLYRYSINGVADNALLRQSFFLLLLSITTSFSGAAVSAKRAWRAPTSRVFCVEAFVWLWVAFCFISISCLCDGFKQREHTLFKAKQFTALTLYMDSVNMYHICHQHCNSTAMIVRVWRPKQSRGQGTDRMPWQFSGAALVPPISYSGPEKVFQFQASRNTLNPTRSSSQKPVIQTLRKIFIEIYVRFGQTSFEMPNL